jgi:hypothetical protein
MGEKPELKDYDQQLANDIWEDSLTLADEIIPIVLASFKNSSVEKKQKNQDLSLVIIRRTLSLFLIACFMNRTSLNNKNLDDALTACKNIAEKMMADSDKPRSIIQ